MEVKSAEFVMSNTAVDKCPNQPIPEYAFIGRSNVGKSSLINMLVKRKSLAKTSGRPGKTQLINHFIINKNWFLVDLPGYGYAQVSKKAKKTFQKFITQYFEKRRQLVLAFILVDIRHEPQPIDVEFMAYLGHKKIPFHIIFTKADKLKSKAQKAAVKRYEEILLAHWEEMPHCFITSSSNGLGRAELLHYIEQLNQSLKLHLKT